MNLLIHKARLYSIFKDNNAKIKWNIMLERTGKDRVIRSINGGEADSVIFGTDNKFLYYGLFKYHNASYEFDQLCGKEFVKKALAMWLNNERLFWIDNYGEFWSINPKNIVTEEPKLEGGNFANLTAFHNCVLKTSDEKTHNVLVTADQYYRIRVWDRDN